MPEHLSSVGRLRALWALVSADYPSYDLLLPGDPAFICQPQSCDAWCCRNLSVPLDDRELARLAHASGRQVVDLVELEDGRPIRLPLAQPFLLARADNHCAHLGDSLGCSVYDGRPGACRLYPHQVLVIDPETGRPLHTSPSAARVAGRALIADQSSAAVPLLLRHTACPGFTAPPLDEAAWARLLTETIALQFPLE
ncbi:MAG TPA: YkgJ family cysteine cluster protein [Tepidiformaceae bacterium]|nr:YkgJ family cysteine cluster protein [Tepidiformaceae bacterium]